MAYQFRIPKVTDFTLDQQAALNETGPIAINGGPGTGKSVISLWRHCRNISNRKSSLLLTYTKTLTEYLSLSAEQINSNASSSVLTAMSWCNSRNKSHYSEIIVDEAQDLSENDLNTINNHASKVSYGADNRQQLYPDKGCDEDKLQEIFSNKVFGLSENFRNTYEIMRFVKAFMPSKDIQQEILDSLWDEDKRGNKPKIFIYDRYSDEEEEGILGLIEEYFSGNHNIAILVPSENLVNEYYEIAIKSGKECSKYHNNIGEVTIENLHVTTFKSAKGTEFDTVIIPRFNSYYWFLNNTNGRITEADYFVGLTRARFNLFLFANSGINVNSDTYEEVNL
jgi:superfamily I DNA/RNA helicase